ncbi:MAG: MjaI family restriction endonuclease [Bacteroidales bacterium]
MKKIKLKSKEIQDVLTESGYEYPKYSTQLINLANQNSQGTRPSVVGQMSDLIQEFKGNSIKEWEKWYLEKHPDAIEKAVSRIYPMIENMKEIISLIDRDMVQRWVEDLVITKTFAGLKFQEVIIKSIGEKENLSYCLAEPEEESKGIDGFINQRPISIKPVTYKMESRLPEHIDVPIVYYEKKTDGIVIEYLSTDFK